MQAPSERTTVQLSVQVENTKTLMIEKGYDEKTIKNYLSVWGQLMEYADNKGIVSCSSDRSLTLHNSGMALKMFFIRQRTRRSIMPECSCVCMIYPSQVPGLHIVPTGCQGSFGLHPLWKRMTAISTSLGERP